MLSGHAIGAEGAAAFGAALGGENGNSLRRLCLGSQAFGDAGVEALASFMCTWNALEDLDLELKGITAAGAGHLGHGLAENTTVKKVNLSRNDLKDAGVAALLETCWISNSDGGDESSPSCQVSELYLSETSCGPLGLKAIASALSRPECTLRVLKCDKNPDIGANVFAHAGDGVGDGGDDGALWPSCRHTVCQRSNFVVISDSRSAIIVSLAKCELGDAGVTCLCKGLTDNRSLVKLDLGYNGVGPDGCRALALALTKGGTLI